MRKIDRIVIHCSATPPQMDIGVNTIRGWHTLERKWSDIGYHYVITLGGDIQIGRPLERVGSHARGFNTSSIGVCYVGGLDEDFLSSDTRTIPQKVSMMKLICELQNRFPSIEHISGHCDLPNVTKSCPCFNVKKWLDEES